MTDPTAAQGTVFRNLVPGPKSAPRSFYTKALVVSTPSPVDPDPTQTKLLTNLRKFSLAPVSMSLLLPPLVTEVYFPPPPPDPDPPPVIIPDPPPVVPPPTPEDPDPDPVSGELGEIGLTPDVSGSLTLVPDPADTATITPNAGS